MDMCLRDYIDEIYQYARLGRYASIGTQAPRFLEILAAVRSDGCAMRYLDHKGRIAWKTTPRLRDHLRDLRLDAEADYADQDV